MSKLKRFLIIAVTLIISFAMLSSVIFIAVEADHDCSGEECEICCAITACINVLRIFNAAVAFSAVSTAAFYAVIKALGRQSFTSYCKTPVALKTKLLN